MLKLNLQYFGHLMPRANSLEKTVMLGKMEGRRRRGWQRTRRLDGITDSMDMSLTKLQEMVEDRAALCAAVCGVTKTRTWLSDWTTASLKQLLNRILQPSVYRLKTSGNSYFTEPGWVHNQWIVFGTRNDWLGLLQTHRRALGHKGSCHSGKQFDERDQPNSLQILGRVLQTWSYHFPLERGRCSNTCQSLMTGALWPSESIHNTTPTTPLWKWPHPQKEARHSGKC